MLTNVSLVGRTQHVRQQTLIKSHHTCNLIKAYNSIKARQRNKPVWEFRPIGILSTQ